MTDQTIPSTEFQNRAGRYMDAAAKAPVFITKYDRPVRVLMDIDEYERLKALDTRQSFHVSDAPDDILNVLNETLESLSDVEATDYVVQKF